MFSFLTKCVILNLSQLFSFWEIKPNCKGEPLKPEQFSNEGDIGFIRDVFVDILARNIYNSLGYPVSQTCEELANMKTSSCSYKCLKWKRSSEKNMKAMLKVMEKAAALVEELLKVVSKNVPENISVGEFVYERTKDAQRRLIDAGVTAEESHIIGQMEDMKLFLCKRCTILESTDMSDAVNQFSNVFEARFGVNIGNVRIEDTVVEQATITGLFCLRFDFEYETNIHTGSVIVKIPSLAPFYHSKWSQGFLFYVREAHFYASILPALYQMGNCEPFAPRADAVTSTYALVLEDLTISGYKSSPSIKSLDLDQIQSFLYVLAQYHALSYMYFENLNDDNPIKELVGPNQQTVRIPIPKNEFDLLCKIVKPFVSETLYQKILTTEDKILATFPMQNKDDPNSINVIMHGDLHRKNFLFKYDPDGKVSGVKIIDWQLGTVGSPALDLIEFIIENIHEEIFEANEDGLLEYYIATFNHYLSAVQSSRTYDRLELNRDMAFFKYYYFRVFSTTVAYWGASQSQENYDIVAKNIANWIMYLEKKGFI